MTVVTQPPAAGAAPRAKAEPAAVLERPDEAAALITARVTGKKVKITGMTSETAEFVALPNGSVESTVHAAPVRLWRGGRWVDVDLELRRNTDGSVAPVAHPFDLRIAGGHAPGAANVGGVGELAAVGLGDDRVSMGWSGALPEPELEANRATYREVKPGIDLVVEATRSGVEQFLVVKNRAAVAQVGRLVVPLTGRSVASHARDASGGVTLKDKAGRTIATSPTPYMWDARLGPDGQTPAHQVPVTSSAVGRRAIAVAPNASTKPGRSTTGNKATQPGVELSLTPDAGFLNDPATVFPVTIDPALNPVAKTTFDTYVKEGDDGDHGGANDLQLGLLRGTPLAKTRSFVHWDLSRLAGKQITAATAFFYNFWSDACTAQSWEIWSTGPASSATRWRAQPAWLFKEGTSTQTKGGGRDCTSGDGWVSIPAKTFVQRAVSNKQKTGYMGIRATDEGHAVGFKQFRSRNADVNTQVPYATVTYNSYPTVGARSTDPASACATGAARPFVNSRTPLLKAVISDAEKSPVKGIFEWWATGGAKIGGITTGAVASGTTLPARIPAGAFAENGTYSWRVAGNDGTVNGGFSPFCEFTVDTVAPSAAPAVSSSAYPSGQWAGSATTAGAFAFSAGGVADVAAYEYGLDVNPPNQSVNATALGGPGSASITPGSDGPHTLYVRSRDRAGNRSGIVAYTFNVGAGAVTSPKAGDISAAKTAITGVGQPAATGVTYQWRRGEADAWADIPTGHVTVASGGGAVSWPLATTGRGEFPRVNWDVAATLAAVDADSIPRAGPLQLRGNFTGAGAGTSGAVTFTFDRTQASAASQDIGPGSVNLITGNYTLSDTDVSVDSYGTDLSVSRSYNTRRPAETDAANMFGPGWVSAALVEEAESPYTSLSVYGSLVQVGLPDGDTLGFAKRNATAFDAEPGLESMRLTYTASTDSYRLGDEEGNVVVFTRVAGTAAGRYFPTAVSVPGNTQTTTLSWEKVTIGGKEVVRPIRMLAPTAAGITCTTLVRGCRALTFSYATSTTATGSAEAGWGDFAGRVKEIGFTAWDPDATTPAMRTVPQARYAYDNGGRLRASWDPRLDFTSSSGPAHLWDTYNYTLDGVLATVTPAGQEPWHLAFTTLPDDPGVGRLHKVSRSALDAGTAVNTVVYRVPTEGAAAPYDLSPTQTARWGQPEAPTDATAVFPANQVPTGNPAAGGLPASWERASITYLDANARQVNTAAPGGHLTATWYDKTGNVTRTLDAGNRQRALAASETDETASETLLAQSYSSQNIFSADGQRLVESYGPEHEVVLPDGSSVRGRAVTHNTYDEGAPATDVPYNLVTTERQFVRYWTADGTSTDADVRVTTTAYDWTLRQPTVSTVDPKGLAQATRTTYDPATGLTTSTTGPAGGSTTNTPATRQTVYYRAGTGSGVAECDNRPEWANLACRVGPGGQAASGPELPVTVTTYDMFNQPRVVTEKTTTATLRTTTTRYDTAGRSYETTATAAAGLGTAVPATRNVYDPATGLLLRTQSVVGGTVTAEIVRTYDTLGRLRSYTDADENTSTTTYDLLGRTATTHDGKAARTYTYDGGSERRGLLTSVDDTQAGVFAGSYDANGALATEKWPNGITVATDTDETGTQKAISYTRPNCGTDDCTLYRESVVESVHGEWRERESTLSSQTYAYDSAARLSTVHDVVDGQCTVRGYGLSRSSNREKLTEYGPGGDGACQTAEPASTKTWTYDTADRVTTAGYAYDALGRTTTVPAGETANAVGGDLRTTYHQSDLVDTVSQGGRITDYTLDVDGERIRSWTDSGSSAAIKATHHYDGEDDNPAWTQESNTRYTRVVAGLAGMASVFDSESSELSWKLANLHGDVVATIRADDLGLSSTAETDEFGNPRNSADVGAARYGWLGAKQRAADTPSGIVLMGVRLYNPTTGRFLQVDPVYGGNANPYDYCSGDPINCFDLDGKWSWRRALSSAGRWASRNKWDIALTAASFIPGVGALAWGYRAYRIVRIARASRGMGGGIRATRATSRLAGRMWSGGRAQWRGGDNGGRRLYSRSGYRQYRPPAYKGGKHGWQSNFEWRSGSKGRMMNNYHVNHRSPRRWAPWW